jgi:polysaccharide biosynthesis protein PslH
MAVVRKVTIVVCSENSFTSSVIKATISDPDNSPLKILAIGPVSPQDMLNGAGVRVHHLVSRLRKLHDVQYLHFKSTDLSEHDVTTITVTREELAHVSALKRIARWVRLDVPTDFSPAMALCVSQMLAKRKFDVILTFDFASLQYAVGRNLPIVADLIDEPVLGAHRDLAITRDVMQKVRLLKHIVELRLYLRRFCRHVYSYTLVGEEDARSLHSIIPRAKIEVIPNGVDTSYFAPGDTPSEPFTVLFFGNLGFEPNILALQHFAEHIFPIIREHCPQVHWYVIGPNCSRSLLALKSEHVSIVGFVPDLRPYLARAAVVVSPLISGGGIKNKVLEAWAMRKPVVATPLGCSGLAAEDGRNILIGNYSAEFAQKTVELLTDRVLAESIAEGGYKTALEKYSWDQSAARLESILRHAKDGAELQK